MPQFAEVLSRRLRYPVLDMTGFAGAYRLTLQPLSPLGEHPKRTDLQESNPPLRTPDLRAFATP
jgi:uncharacterized protein (TIGR03435 family)